MRTVVSKSGDPWRGGKEAQEGHDRAVFRVTADPSERTHCWSKALKAAQGVCSETGSRNTRLSHPLLVNIHVANGSWEGTTPRGQSRRDECRDLAVRGTP